MAAGSGVLLLQRIDLPAGTVDAFKFCRCKSGMTLKHFIEVFFIVEADHSGNIAGPIDTIFQQFLCLVHPKSIQVINKILVDIEFELFAEVGCTEVNMGGYGFQGNVLAVIDFHDAASEGVEVYLTS